MSETIYHGMYRAIVCDINDPERRGRIRVQVPSVLGNYLSSWCEPCIPYATDYAGDYYVPPLGEGIWVQFEDGDVNKPIWNGGWYKVDSSPLPKSANPEDFRFITFKDSVLRMGEHEFIFELRNGESSYTVTINNETWKGLNYISSYDEQKIEDLEAIVVNREWILETRPQEENELFEELATRIKSLGDTFNDFTQEVFPEAINQCFDESRRVYEISHAELEDVVNQLNGTISTVNDNTGDISALQNTLNNFINLFNSNMEKINHTLEAIDNAHLLPEETEKMELFE